jgi:Fe-Mn family superoxide dismutase
MSHTLPALPYSYDALEPYIDARTMEIHHTKHHQGYINNLNAALKEHPRLETLSVEQLLRNLKEIPESIRRTVRNQGGGHANHSFFWPLLKKGITPSGPAPEAIALSFGSMDRFQEKFAGTAVRLFGSGWVWLVMHKGKLEIEATPNQDNPRSVGNIPILGLDVWEHAYYLLYQNRRAEYVDAFFHIINWEKVNENFLKAVE